MIGELRGLTRFGGVSLGVGEDYVAAVLFVRRFRVVGDETAVKVAQELPRVLSDYAVEKKEGHLQ